jgi:hypothetical protein
MPRCGGGMVDPGNRHLARTRPHHPLHYCPWRQHPSAHASSACGFKLANDSHDTRALYVVAVRRQFLGPCVSVAAARAMYPC